MTRAALPFAVVIAWAAAAGAEPSATVSGGRTSGGRTSGDEVVEAATFDPAKCGLIDAARRPPQPVVPAPAPQPAGDAVPVVPPASATWIDWELTGELREPAPTVRALLAPTMTRLHALTVDARGEIQRVAGEFGYHVLGLGTRETPGGTHAIVHLVPMPMIRVVNVDMRQSLFDTLLEDEVRRRMTVRTGEYLPWLPSERACTLHETRRRIVEFLNDEGFFDAEVTIQQSTVAAGVTLKLVVRLGPEYTTAIDRIQIPNASEFMVDAEEIRAKFRHRGTCLIGQYLCIGGVRFTRAQHQADVQKVVDLFHDRGYPAVRVRSDFDKTWSIDRRTKTVRFAIAIDPRRKLDLVFEGRGGVSVESLRKQLTFDQAQSADQVEIANSARAVAAYLQSRGYFDARVTVEPVVFPKFDRLIFRIDLGRTRAVKSVAFAGNRALSGDELNAVIGTKPARLSTTLFGSAPSATSAMLDGDVQRLRDLYRRRGYRSAEVRVSASTDPSALDSVAATAGLLLADRGSGLHVRFTIVEGELTRISRFHIDLGDKGDQVTGPADRELCDQVLRDLAEVYRRPPLAQPASPDRCIASVPDLAFREDDTIEGRDRLKDRLYDHGRPRAEVAYSASELAPHQMAIRYRVSRTQKLVLGKIVLRGNFKTRDSIIFGELRMREGQLLTKDLLPESARRLRNTGLFDAVNIELPDLEHTSAGAVNAVIEVTERYDFRMQLDLETGYSSFNGAFVKMIPSLKNLFGIGLSLDVAGTIGFDLTKLTDLGFDDSLRQLGAEATLRIPRWLSRRVSPVEFQTELTAFHDRRETPRFGLLRTTGATVGLSRTWERQRIGPRAARAITTGLHYDFRSRERNVDALRPIGADDDDSQVPITTRTGSVGLTFEWEQRVDKRGALSPLAPERGFRFDGQVAFADKYLGGQNTFIKVSAAGSRYQLIGSNLLLRGDLRYDHGIPLGEAVLLPEVERFFAGGDSTVRGYNDDRMATEIVEVGVPPFDDLSQIRILPAGGNIRVLGSVDAQLRIYGVLATAVFVDAGIITNQWTTAQLEDIRPSAGIALFRAVTPFGAFAMERAVPLRPRLGDDPRGRWHISFAARGQF